MLRLVINLGAVREIGSGINLAGLAEMQASLILFSLTNSAPPPSLIKLCWWCQGGEGLMSCFLYALSSSVLSDYSSSGTILPWRPDECESVGRRGMHFSIYSLAPCPADCLSVVISSGWAMSPFNSQILGDERIAIEGLLSADLTYFYRWNMASDLIYKYRTGKPRLINLVQI